MPLYLVQHGVAFAEDINPDRPLTLEGKEATDASASFMAGRGVDISEIVHSGKTRALETATLFADRLGQGIAVTEVKNLSPNDDVAILAKGLSGAANLMVVGHLPYLSRLASLLLAGNPDQPIVSFKNSGVVCLDEGQDGWVLCWAFVP